MNVLSEIFTFKRNCIFFSAIAFVSVLASLSEISDYGKVQWLYTYEVGFTKRAFIGSIIKWVSGDYSESRLIAVISILAVFLFAAMLTWMICKAFEQSDSPLIWLSGICLISAPAALPLITSNLGAFDVFLYILLLGGLFIIPWLNQTASVICISLISVTGIAVHEAFFVAQLPLLLAFLYVMHLTNTKKNVEKNQYFNRALIILIPSVFALTALFVVNSGSPLSSEAFGYMTEKFSSHIDGTPDNVESALMVQQRTITDNVLLTFSSVSASAVSIGGRLAIILAAIPALFVAMLLFANIKNNNRLLILLIASLSPILLFLLGTDWGRWCMMITLNLFIAGLWSTAQGFNRENILDYLSYKNKTRYGYLLFLIITATVISALMLSVSPGYGLYNMDSYMIFHNMMEYINRLLL